MQKHANASISLSKINVKDKFWKKYVDLVKGVIIPYQWEVLNDRLEDVETSHCIENFKIAAKIKDGSFQGAVFQDTDVAKWLEAVGFVLSIARDEELEKLADDTIELIGRAQCEDGYLNTYYTIQAPGLRWSNLMEGHELYTAGHMIEAAVAYYEATGKDHFLKIVCKFADLICKTFGSEEGQIEAYPGHPEIELALVKLYRVTGKKRYLEMAKYFIDMRGVGENYFLKEEKTEKYKRIFPEFDRYDPKYSQSHLPVREQRSAEGHAVRAVYLYCAMADIAQEYQDESLKEACRVLWENIISKRMYLTGSIGSSGLLERFTTDYDLPNDTNYSETCASIGLALFGKRMAEMEKDASYIDVVELALYNTLLAGIAMDGKSFFYVNPLEVWPANCLERTSREHVKAARQKWFGVACCPPNIARTLASLGQYIYFEEKEALYVNLFISNETETELNGNKYSLKMETDFPWSSKISICIDGEKEGEAEFYFRIPAYAQNYKILLDGKETVFERSKGYAKINGRFFHNHIIIEFEAPARYVHANPKVRADEGKTAIMKGPLVYCLEEVDNGDNLSSIYADTSKELIEIFDGNLLGGLTVIHACGKKIESEEWKDNELYGEKKTKLTDVTIKAVPYYCWGNRGYGEMLVWLKECIS